MHGLAVWRDLVRRQPIYLGDDNVDYRFFKISKTVNASQGMPEMYTGGSPHVSVDLSSHDAEAPPLCTARELLGSWMTTSPCQSIFEQHPCSDLALKVLYHGQNSSDLSSDCHYLIISKAELTFLQGHGTLPFRSLIFRDES